MTDGWIKLHRELLEKAIWKTSTTEQRVILITILLLANHEENQWEWEGKKFICKAGQLITSSTSLAQKSGVSRQNVRTALKKFKEYEFLTYQSTKTGILLTVINWDKYQVREKEPNQDTNQSLTNSQPTPNQPLTTNKNDKNDKKYIYKPEDEQEIFSYWNQKGIVTHQKITNHFHISIKRALMLYPVEQIKTAIDHYATMYFDESYSYCDYKWTIEKFLDDPKGIAYFFNDGQKWLSYINLRKGGSKNGAEKIDDSDLIL